MEQAALEPPPPSAAAGAEGGRQGGGPAWRGSAGAPASGARSPEMTAEIIPEMTAAPPRSPPRSPPPPERTRDHARAHPSSHARDHTRSRARDHTSSHARDHTRSRARAHTSSRARAQVRRGDACERWAAAGDGDDLPAAGGRPRRPCCDLREGSGSRPSLLWSARVRPCYRAAEYVSAAAAVLARLRARLPPSSPLAGREPVLLLASDSPRAEHEVCVVVGGVVCGGVGAVGWWLVVGAWREIARDCARWRERPRGCARSREIAMCGMRCDALLRCELIDDNE